MPTLEPTYPPASTVTQPRQLNRWLDVNPQGGALTRTHGYFTLPSFDIDAQTWRGFSIIVGSFNYTSSKPFSLRADTFNLPTGTNYTLCISWVDGNNVVYRYSLIRGENDLFNFGLEPYVGQVIEENFRIEIWNTEDSESTNASDYYIYSTILGSVDYMYGSDFVIAAPSFLCTGQAYIDSSVTTPSTTDRLFWWTASQNVDPDINLALINSWNDVDNGYLLDPTALGPTYRNVAVGNFLPNSLEFVSFVDLSNGNNFGQIKHIFFTYKTIGGTGPVLELVYVGQTALISQPDATTKLELELGLSSATTDDVFGTAPCIVELIFGSSGSIDTINIYNALTRSIIQTTRSLIVYPFVASTTFKLGNNVSGGGFLISDFIGHSEVLDQDDRNQTLEYLFNLFSTGSAIPLEPSACAQPTLNPV